MNPQPSVLETAALPLELLGCFLSLTRFLVQCMPVAPLAVFFQLEPLRVRALVFVRRVIATLAL